MIHPENDGLKRQHCDFRFICCGVPENSGNRISELRRRDATSRARHLGFAMICPRFDQFRIPNPILNVRKNQPPFFQRPGLPRFSSTVQIAREGLGDDTPYLICTDVLDGFEAVELLVMFPLCRWALKHYTKCVDYAIVAYCCYYVYYLILYDIIIYILYICIHSYHIWWLYHMLLCFSWWGSIGQIGGWITVSTRCYLLGGRHYRQWSCVHCLTLYDHLLVTNIWDP